MANFDDLIKGMAVFNQGLTELAVSKATADAQEQLNQLNQQQLDRKDALQAQAAIGNNLALRMQAAGADAAQISAVANRLSPSAGEMYQSQEAQDRQTQSEEFAHKEGRLKAQDAKDLEAMKLTALTGKNAKAQQKLINGFGAEFDKMPDVKPILDNMPKLDDALEKIKENKGQMGITSMINLAQLGLIRGAAGRVNEKEIEGANESQSKRAQLWKKMGLESQGEVPMNIQEFWQKVIQRAKDNAEVHVRDKARGFAQSKEDASDGDISADSVEQMLLHRHGLSKAAAAAQGAAKPQASGASGSFASPVPSNINKYLSN